MSTSAIMSIPDKPFIIMGIVNVTPDSFYDGGRYETISDAVKQGEFLRNQGADILDIGGASSRPGAEPVDPEAESRRVVPVIERLITKVDCPISIDTTWAAVARRALDAGAQWVNDISAGRFDNEMAPLVASRKCTIVIMHSRGTPSTMQIDPKYSDVTSEVIDELNQAITRFRNAGVTSEQIIIDPGIGFAKTQEHNITLLRELERFKKLGFPVLIGTSRKSFIGTLTGKGVNDRLYGTLGSIGAAYRRGAAIFRVHDVGPVRDFLTVLTAIEK